MLKTAREFIAVVSARDSAEYLAAIRQGKTVVAWHPDLGAAFRCHVLTLINPTADIWHARLRPTGAPIDQHSYVRIPVESQPKVVTSTRTLAKSCLTAAIVIGVFAKALYDVKRSKPQ